METTFFRDSQGWNGKTTVEMPGKQELIIETSRCAFGNDLGNGLFTRAAIWRHDEHGFKSHAAGLAGTGDYYERLELSIPKRITEKAVREQHAAVIARIDDIRSKVLAYYSKA